MSQLSSHDVVANCRTAFDAAEKLGIPRVIEPRDMSLLAVPDKLAVMTYLYQLRAHFTGHQLQIEQIGNTSDESSYVIGNYKTDNLASHNIMKLDHLKLHLNSHQQYISMLDEDGCDINGSGQKSPTEKKDVKNLILTGSKHLLGKVLSPVKDKNSIATVASGQPLSPPTQNNQTLVQPQNNQTLPKEKPILMTRRELTDPFGSDDEDEQKITTARENDIQQQNKELSVTTAPSLDPVMTNVCIQNTENCYNYFELFFFMNFYCFLIL